MIFDHIDKWVASKGYGFTKEKRFVHHSVLRPLLAKEDVVTPGTLICGEVTKTERGEQFTEPTIYGHRAIWALRRKDTKVVVNQYPPYDHYIEYKDFYATHALSKDVWPEERPVCDDELTPQQILNWRDVLKRMFGFGSMADTMSDDDVRACHRIVQNRVILDSASILAEDLDNGDEDLVKDAASIVVAHAKNSV